MRKRYGLKSCFRDWKPTFRAWSRKTPTPSANTWARTAAPKTITESRVSWPVPVEISTAHEDLSICLFEKENRQLVGIRSCCKMIGQDPCYTRAALQKKSHQSSAKQLLSQKCWIPPNLLQKWRNDHIHTPFSLYLDLWPFIWPPASVVIICLSTLNWTVFAFLAFLYYIINIYIQYLFFVNLLTWLWRMCVLRVELNELVFIAMFVMGVDEFMWMFLFLRHFVFQAKGSLDMWWDQIHSLGSYPLAVLHSRDVILTSNTQAFSQVSTSV